jgi:uncharacterized protein (TIGR03000 family)
MFSVVLMVALTGGADVPAFGHHGCHGCSGGYSGCWESCSGSYGGGWASCSGGYGGGWASCSGAYEGGWASCSGGWSSCSCSGHHHGHHRRHRHHGCHGCHGSSGCWSSCSGSYGCWSSFSGSYGCTGDLGGYGCTGDLGGYGCFGAPAYGAPEVEPLPQAPAQGTQQKVQAEAPATVIVRLPADAKLTIDGAATSSTSTQRVFETPTLKAGQDYYYSFKATVVRDGRPVTAEQQVRVRAGLQTPIQFDFASTGLVMK